MKLSSLIESKPDELSREEAQEILSKFGLKMGGRYLTNISSAGTYNPTIVPAQIAGLMRISNSTDDYQIFRARVLVLTGPNKKKFFWTSSLVINDGRASSASNVFRPVDGREIERKMKSLSNKIAKLQSELNDLEAFKEFFA